MNNSTKIVALIPFGAQRHIIDFTGHSFLSDLLDEVNHRWPELVPEKTILKFVTPDPAGDLIILRRDIDVKKMHYMHQALGVASAKLEAELIMAPPRQASPEQAPFIDINEASDDESQGSLDSNYAPLSQAIVKTSQPMDYQNCIFDAWQRSISGIGQIFEDAPHFRETICKYSISHLRDFRYVKNEPERITVVCAKDDCNWRVHSSKSSKDQTFAIRTANLVHTCTVTLDDNQHKKASQSWVATIIKEKLRHTPLVRPSDIVKEVSRMYKVNLPYHKAWRGKEIAMQEIHGKDVMSYNSLQWYCEAIKRTNPCSVAELVVSQSNNRFQRLFVAYDACLQGFRRGCRPLLFVDGTFMKNKYKGVLFSATALDGNNQMFVVAVGVVDAENDDNWRWFFMMLRSCLPRDRTYVIMSDRQQGIRKAVAACFPDSYHLHCLFHLLENFKTEVLKYFPRENKQDWLEMFDNAAKTVDGNAFTKLWSQIIGTLRTQKTKGFFDNARPSHWANAVYPGPRWGQMTNNLAESFNSWILEERNLPVPSMIDGIRVKIMTLMHERKHKAATMQTTLCTNAENKLMENCQESRGYDVRASTALRYEVRASGIVYAVNLEDGHRACSCQIWRIEGIPCPHACAAIGRARLSPYQFCDPCFFTDMYKEAYSESINPVSTFDKPTTDPNGNAILPPATKSMPGRRKKLRFKSKRYRKNKVTCSRCHESGHNRRNCKRPIADD